ncbi:YlcG family protein [Citrobacter freundii]|nr:YlcG family protein [Citrobacter sp. RHBSTW-00599]QLY03573.1 YlcG family protein [Citrobacter sp. RHBSTW-00599]
MKQEIIEALRIRWVRLQLLPRGRTFPDNYIILRQFYRLYRRPEWQ